MTIKLITSVILGTSLSAFLVGAATQQSQNNQDQPTQSQSAPGMMGQGQGMMGGGMAGMMGQMQEHHQQMTVLMRQLMDSMTAIRSEKDPAKLKTEMEEHQKLLDQMRSQMMGQGNRMNMMSGQMKSACPGAGAASNAPSRQP